LIVLSRITTEGLAAAALKRLKNTFSDDAPTAATQTKPHIRLLMRALFFSAQSDEQSAEEHPGQ
jgi:hypothetical protein